MTEKTYTRKNTKTGEEKTYKAIYGADNKLKKLVNETTGCAIPAHTRTFKKLAAGHAVFVEKK